MTSVLRVLIEQPPKGKRWVAIAADWPGLERNGRDQKEAVAKLQSYAPRYLSVAKRARLGSELASQTDTKIIGRHLGTGSTDFWGISFAPSKLDRAPMDDATFERASPAAARGVGRIRRDRRTRLGGAAAGPARWRA